MSRLDKVEWDDGEGLENLQIWGVEPIRALAQAIQQYDCVGVKCSVFIPPMAFLIEDRIDEINSVLDRFIDELNKLGKQKEKKGGES